MFTEPFMGFITPFAGNFAPVGWAFCNGLQVQISFNETLYALIGTTYGGDGVNTFNLPDLRGRVAVHAGQMPGGSFYSLGQTGGTETATLTNASLAVHGHPLLTITGKPGASTANGDKDDPTANVPAVFPGISNYNTGGSSTMGATDTSSVTPPSAGGGNPIESLSPFTAINYIICTEGIFPPRN